MSTLMTKAISTDFLKILEDSKTRIMLDAGIPIKPILTALNYKLPDYVLITHEYGDHAQKSTLKTLFERGVET